MSEYKITIEYDERTEYEIKFDSEGYPCAGNIYDHMEQDPQYLVRELSLDDEGKVWYDECLEAFDTYEEAKKFIEERERNEQ